MNQSFLKFLVALKRADCFSLKEKYLLGSLVRFLGEENSLDVREDSTLSNGDTSKKLVQLLVISDGKLKMSWDDSGLLVVTGSITSQLKNLSSKVLHDSSQIDWSSSTNTGSIVTLAEETVNTSNWELESGTAGPRLCLGLNFSTLSTSRHFDMMCCSFKLELTVVAGAPDYIHLERFHVEPHPQQWCTNKVNPGKEAPMDGAAVIGLNLNCNNSR